MNVIWITYNLDLLALDQFWTKQRHVWNMTLVTILIRRELINVSQHSFMEKRVLFNWVDTIFQNEITSLFYKCNIVDIVDFSQTLWTMLTWILICKVEWYKINGTYVECIENLLNNGSPSLITKREFLSNVFCFA